MKEWSMLYKSAPEDNSEGCEELELAHPQVGNDQATFGSVFVIILINLKNDCVHFIISKQTCLNRKIEKMWDL